MFLVEHSSQLSLITDTIIENHVSASGIFSSQNLIMPFSVRNLYFVSRARWLLMNLITCYDNTLYKI